MSLAAFFRWFRKRPRNVVPKVYAPEFSVRALSLVQGSTVQTTVTFRRADYTGTITPTISGLPSGVSGAFDPATLNASTLTTTLTLTATGGASIVSNDPFSVSCTATGSPDLTGNTETATVTVTASATPAIAIVASKSSTTALQGDSDNFDVTLTRTNYTGDVTLAVSGLPSGATASISPNPLTGGTVTAGVVITNDIAASTVTNDAYTVGATGSGVAAATNVNMTHTITSPNVTRGVFNYSNVVKGSDFSTYADTTALLAAIGTTESDANKQKLLTSTGTGNSSPANCIQLVTSSVTGNKAMRYLIDNTHGVPNTTMMWFAGYPGMPTANRTGGVSTPFTDCAVYSEVSYSPGFTTAGSKAGGQGYKQYAIGYSNAAGRTGMEYSNIYDCTYTIGWNNNGNGNFGDVGGSGSSTVPINGTPRPWSANGNVWAVEQVVCFYTEMRAVDADSLRHKSWTWLKGSEPTALPQLDYTVNIGGGSSLPTANRVAWCENFNQDRGLRYIPDGSYMDVHYIGVVDLTFDSNPANF